MIHIYYMIFGVSFALFFCEKFKNYSFKCAKKLTFRMSTPHKATHTSLYLRLIPLHDYGDTNAGQLGQASVLL